MQRSLRILYCTDQLYKHGGAERVTTTKLNGWVEHTNNQIHLVTTEQNNKPFCYGLDSRVKTNDLAINYHREITYFSFVNIKKTFLYVLRLRKLIKSLKPDIIVCVNSGPINLFLPFIAGNSITINEYHASKSKRLNVINSKNSSFFKVFLNKLSNLIEGKFSSCVVLNESETKYFSSNNVVVIPNPIDIPIYEEHLRKKVVVAAGRIAPVKGYDLLINVWGKIIAAHPDWKLQIYGDGDDELQKELQKQVESLGLSKSISFCGVTNNLNHVFFTSSIHVLSSLEESFGMVILEAQACGLPSVAFNCPTGPEKLIQDGVNGFLVKPLDVNTLAVQLNYLIKHPEIRIAMGNKAILNVNKYAISTIIKSWDCLFRKLLNI